ncbi:MAG: hypothetical protein ACOYNM_13785, partial [Gemmataceae bacterium]
LKNGEPSNQINTQFIINDHQPILLEARRDCPLEVVCIPGRVDGDDETIEANLVLGIGHSPSDVVIKRVPLSVTIKKPRFQISLQRAKHLRGPLIILCLS